MHHGSRHVLAALAHALIGIPLAAQTACGVPHLVGLPHPTGSDSTRLYDVTAFGPDDVWAVGTSWRTVGTQSEARSWTLHWDGTRFTEVPAPSPNIPGLPPSCMLQAVGGSAPDDLWAAGNYSRQHPNNGHIGPQILLLHWDGSTWTQVPEPIPQFTYMASSSGSRIQDIVAFASDDVWFFGWWSGDQFTNAGPLALHWNGSSIQIVDIAPLPNSNSNWKWIDVDALSPTDFWGVAAVGGGNYGHYVAHWNGSSWTRHANIPTLPITYYDLFAVGAVAANDVWVAGSEWTLSPPSPVAPYAIHWDGSTWTRRPTNGYVREFVTFASDDVWGFGTMVEHWDGTSWTVVEDLGATLTSAQGWEAIATGPCDLWTVGTQWATSSGPPVVALAAHIGPANAGAAALRLPCTTPVLAQSLLPTNTPRIGHPLRVVVDDPMGVTGASGPLATAWLLALGPGPSAPCGTPVPGLGLGGGSIEVLLDGTATIFSTAVWYRPGQPAEHAAMVPNDPTMIGMAFTSQAVLVTGTGLLATSAIDYVVGI